MYYKFKLTGVAEDWGYGFLSPEKIVVLGNGRFALKDGVDLEEVENPTIEIEPMTEEAIEALKVEQQIPDNWIPSASGIE